MCIYGAPFALHFQIVCFQKEDMVDGRASSSFVDMSCWASAIINIIVFNEVNVVTICACYTVFGPGFQKGRVPSQKGTFSAVNGLSKGHFSAVNGLKRAI